MSDQFEQTPAQTHLEHAVQPIAEHPVASPDQIKALAHVATEGYGKATNLLDADGSVMLPRDLHELRQNGSK